MPKKKSNADWGVFAQRPVGGTDDYEKAHQTTILPRVIGQEVAGDPEKAKRFHSSSVVVRKPHISSLLSEGYGIAHIELRRLTEQVETESLDASQVQKYYKQMDIVIKAAKEERAQMAQDQIEDLELEDLLERAEQAKKVLGS